MVVDYIRSAYRTDMRFWSNRPDILTPVVWTRVPDGTLPVPYFGVFASANWDDPHEAPDDALGEVWQSPANWYSGAPVAAWPAVMPCGSALQWMDGDTYPPSPFTVIPPTYVPPCCTSSPPPPDPCTAMQWKFVAGGATGTCSGFNGTHFTDFGQISPCTYQRQTGSNGFWIMGKRVSPLPSQWIIQGYWDSSNPSGSAFGYTIDFTLVNGAVGGTTVVPLDSSVTQPACNPPQVVLTRLS